AMSDQQRYTGTVNGCGAAAATFTRVGGQFAFAPTDGVLILRGTVAADGAFAGSLNTQPPGKAPFVLAVSGKVDAETVALSYRTPQCQVAATLTRAHSGIF